MSSEAVATTSSFTRLWASLDDRLNPILIKEVRQSLRGRYFRNLFWFTVVAATGISVLRILSADASDRVSTLGPAFFDVNFNVMLVAINLFVPFSAFQSMSSEWEENTYDLLVISNLRPKQLFLGKTLAACVQSLLCFSAFAPYLVSTFLMGGVDLVSIVLVLAGTLMMSAALSMVALAVACFGRSRLVRGILAAAVMAILLGCFGMTTTGAMAMIERPELFRAGDTTRSILMFVTVVPLVATLALAIGCARLAHEHENRSTFLRVVVALTSAVMLGWGIHGAFKASSYIDPGRLEATSAAALGIAIVPFLFFVTEVEPLGRRVEKQVPKSKLRALLALPFLPGGARGLWLYIATAATTLTAVSLAIYFAAPGVSSTLGTMASRARNAQLLVVVMFAYGFVALGLIPGIASFYIRSLRGRTGVRVAVPLLVILAAIVPTLLGFLFDIKSWKDWEHPFNPFWTLIKVDDGRAKEVATALILLAFGVVVTLAVNAGRLLRAVRETMRASAARRERELANRTSP